MNKPFSHYFVRIQILKYVILTIICTYGMYLFVIQVAQGYLYSERAQRSQQRVETIVARRGIITDRHARVIVDNEYTYSLYLIPGSLDDAQLHTLASNLSTFTAIPITDLQKKISHAQSQDAYRVEIGNSFSVQQISYIVEHPNLFPSVHWDIHAFRSYPLHEELAHVTGYVGSISPNELRVLHNQGYEQHTVIGKNGLEFQYDEMLRGNPGSQIISVDAFGNQIDVNIVADPIPGHNIVTSIDTKIQTLAWNALGRRVGSAVVLRPHNGEILAMVSYPSYNPNQFYAVNSQDVLNVLLSNKNSPLINRAIQTAYPPASTFKILMATSIVNEGVYGIHDTILSKGFYELGNSVLYEWDKQDFGHLDLFGGLANSSNVYFWTLGVDYLGVERIVDYSHKFGFGSHTGIDLPNETSGLIPDPEWKKIQFNQRWTDGDTANISIGQGFINTSPLQIANMVAAISNNGIIYTPHVLKEIRDGQTGEVVRQYTPEILHNLKIDPETFAIVQNAMRGVIEEGTGSSVITTPIARVAGKTGTSEVQKGIDRFHSWFVAYAPVDAAPERQVVVVVFVDAVNEWEWWAPKAANIILHGIFSDTDYEKTVHELRNSPGGLWYL